MWMMWTWCSRRSRLAVVRDFVAGEDPGPVAHGLIGGQDDRALLVAGAHEAEEEVRLLALEGPEAHLVDDEGAPC